MRHRHGPVDTRPIDYRIDHSIRPAACTIKLRALSCMRSVHSARAGAQAACLSACRAASHGWGCIKWCDGWCVWGVWTRTANSNFQRQLGQMQIGHSWARAGWRVLQKREGARRNQQVTVTFSFMPPAEQWSPTCRCGRSIARRSAPSAATCRAVCTRAVATGIANQLASSACQAVCRQPAGVHPPCT